MKIQLLLRYSRFNLVIAVRKRNNLDIVGKVASKRHVRHKTLA
jgi:hypothetical protein